MRSLWTAASGMIGQQFNIDTISNNLSNVNTTGFKRNRADFEDLLYQIMSSLTSHECAAEITNAKVTFCVNSLANLPLEYAYSFILPCKKVRACL